MGEPIIIHVPGEAVPFARAGANGKRRFTPGKQRNAMTAIGHYAAVAMAGRPPLAGPIRMELQATYLIPPSWSKKRAAAARWKISTPDIGNITKLAEDSLNKIVFADDAQIAWSEQRKQYGPTASLLITITPLD